MFKSLRYSLIVFLLAWASGIGLFIKNESKHSTFSNNFAYSPVSTLVNQENEDALSFVLASNSSLGPFISSKSELPLFRVEIEEEDEDFSPNKKGFKFYTSFTCPKFQHLDDYDQQVLKSFHLDSFFQHSSVPLYISYQVFRI